MNIKTKNLSKSFGNKKVVKDLNIEIKEEKILGLLGPNGAGKSTTIKMLSGQLKPTSGEIIIDKKSYSEVTSDLRGKIGVMPQEVIIWDDLNISENLFYSASLQGMNGNQAKQRVEYLVESLNLQKELKTLARNLSGGYKRRLNLAISIIHEPSLIFLDEPTPGIDAQSRRFMMDYIQKLGNKKNYSIVLTDHYLDEAEKLSDYVVIIDDGEIVAEGTVTELKRKHGDGNILQIDFDSEKVDSSVMNKVSQTFKKDFKDLKVVDKSISTLVKDPSKSMNLAMKSLSELNLNAINIAVKEPTLEDIFLILTGKDIRE